MNIEEVKDTTDQARSFNEWFENEWKRNGVDGLLKHNDQLIDNVKYLLSIIEQAQHALWRISTLNIPAPHTFKTDAEAIQAFANEALKSIQGEG